jgi:hypothetical protein
MTLPARAEGPRIAGDARLDHLRRFAYWMDEGIRIPGTRWRVGLDPILGLVPGVGDAAGALLAAVILVEAARRGLSRFTLGRMAWNIAVDALLGAVPVVGDIFDATWKANLKNVALIDRHAAVPAEARKADRVFMLLLGGSLLLLCLALLAAGVLLTAWFVRVIAAQVR